MSTEHEGWRVLLLVVRAGGDAVIAVAGSRDVDDQDSHPGGNGDGQCADGSVNEAFLRGHVPVVHGDAAKGAKMDACVETCIWPRVGADGNKLLLLPRLDRLLA